MIQFSRTNISNHFINSESSIISFIAEFRSCISVWDLVVCIVILIPADFDFKMREIPAHLYSTCRLDE